MNLISRAVFDFESSCPNEHLFFKARFFRGRIEGLHLGWLVARRIVSIKTNLQSDIVLRKFCFGTYAKKSAYDACQIKVC